MNPLQEEETKAIPVKSCDDEEPPAKVVKREPYRIRFTTAFEEESKVEPEEELEVKPEETEVVVPGRGVLPYISPKRPSAHGTLNSTA